MKLFRVTTYGLKEFYVVALDPTRAENRVKEILNDSDYGNTRDRKVTQITLLSEEIRLFGGKPRPNVTDDNRLILPQSCDKPEAKNIPSMDEFRGTEGYSIETPVPGESPISNLTRDTL